MHRMLLVALLFVGGAACTSPRLIGEGPFLQHDPGPAGPERGGIRYYVGKDLLHLTGTRTTRIAAVAYDEQHLYRRKTENSAGSVDLAPIPDTRQVFRLDLQPAASSEDTLAVTLDGGGILRGINVIGESKAGLILKNVTSFVGTVAGMATGAVSPFTDMSMMSIAPDVVAKRGSRGLPPVDQPRLVGDVLARIRAESPTTAEEQNAARIVGERIARLDEVRRHVLSHSVHAQSLLAQGLYREALILTRQQERIALERAVASADVDALKLLTAKLKAFQDLLKPLQQERTAAYVAFDAEVTRFLSQRGSFEATQEAPFNRYLELSDLPTEDQVRGGLHGARGLDAAHVRARLAGYSAALRVFEETGVLVTLSAPPAGFFEGDGGGTPACTGARRGPSARGLHAPGRVYYRQSYPAILQVWVRTRIEEGPARREPGAIVEPAKAPASAAVEETARKAPLVVRPPAVRESVSLAEEKLVEVMHPSARLEYLEFDPQAFAKHELGLTFDESSRLLTVKRKSSSSLAGLTGAALSAAQGYRDELASTLATVVNIQESRRRIALDPLTTEIEVLEKRKEALDARIALEGATASEDLLLERTRIENELALARSRQSLAQIRGSEGLDDELARLRIELEALRAELDALRRQQALQALPREE